MTLFREVFGFDWCDLGNTVPISKWIRNIDRIARHVRSILSVDFYLHLEHYVCIVWAITSELCDICALELVWVLTAFELHIFW
jgi:hypothetical protein